MSKWEELEKAAMAATPGPWEWLGTNALWGGNQEILKAADDGKPYGMHTAIIEHHWHQETAAANRAFMESANPSAILALLAERDALKAENERLLAANRDCMLHYEDARAELERIRAMEPVAWCLGNPEHSDSSNLFLAHEFEPGGKHKDDWTPLYTLEKP